MFMQMRGTLVWQCPACLWANRNRLQPLQYKLKCQHQPCGRTFAVGLVLYTRPGGVPEGPPPDLVPLDGGAWRNGRVHKVFCDGCSAVIAEHAPPPVDRWPVSEGRIRRVVGDGFAKPVLEKEEETDGISEDS